MIELRGVRKRLGEFELDIPNLCAQAGEYLVLLGPSGAGKTVLLWLVAGILKPDAGQIFLEGAEVTAAPPERRNVGLVSQGDTLFPHLSVRQNIEFGLRYRRSERRALAEHVRRLVALLGIERLLERGVRGLSGGERQRVAIARALAIRPRILLLDEPLATLDHNTRLELRGELRNIHRASGTTTVHVTHDRGEALAVADRIAVLFCGQVLQVGPPEEVFFRPACEFVARFVGAENLFAARAEPVGGGLAELRAGALRVVARTTLRGEVQCCIRPEKLRLQAREPQGEGNALRGTIVGAQVEAGGVRVELRCAELTLVALCGPGEMQRAGLHVGGTAWATVAPDDVHVFPSKCDRRCFAQAGHCPWVYGKGGGN